MERAYKYIMMMSGLMLLFYISGLLGGTLVGTLLNTLFTPESFFSTNFTTYILTMGSLASVGFVASIVIGVVTKNPELAVTLGVSTWLVTLFGDFTKVFLVVYNTNQILAILFFSPIMLLWLIIMVDWWRKVV